MTELLSIGSEVSVRCPQIVTIYKQLDIYIDKGEKKINQKDIYGNEFSSSRTYPSPVVLYEKDIYCLLQYSVFLWLLQFLNLHIIGEGVTEAVNKNLFFLYLSCLLCISCQLFQATQSHFLMKQGRKHIFTALFTYKKYIAHEKLINIFNVRITRFAYYLMFFHSQGIHI